jgi:hypothetical protein
VCKGKCTKRCKYLSRIVAYNVRTTGAHTVDVGKGKGVVYGRRAPRYKLFTLPPFGKMGVTFLVALAFAAGVLQHKVGLFSYLALLSLIDSHLATSLQGRYRLEEKPAVEVASGFPPGLLLGRIDRIEVQMTG